MPDAAMPASSKSPATVQLPQPHLLLLKFTWTLPLSGTAYLQWTTTVTLWRVNFDGEASVGSLGLTDDSTDHRRRLCRWDFNGRHNVNIWRSKSSVTQNVGVKIIGWDKTNPQKSWVGHVQPVPPGGCATAQMPFNISLFFPTLFTFIFYEQNKPGKIK